MNLRKIPV
uniref:Uncharacterized protein n=1 Tax=Arundo donax TaxID=35708 RepID=A0A0A9F803_ARUDO